MLGLEESTIISPWRWQKKDHFLLRHDLRLTYITTKSQLMSLYKRSKIEELVENQGIKTSTKPAYIIDINEK